MKLEIQATGNPKFPRFIIVKDTGEVFDGTGWNQDRKRAEVYVEGQEIAQKFRSLEEIMHDHLPKREFKVTLNVTVRANGEYTKEELATYLESAVAILLDHAKGTGPIPDSLAQLSVTWSQMKEVGKKSVSEDEKK